MYIYICLFLVYIGEFIRIKEKGEEEKGEPRTTTTLERLFLSFFVFNLNQAEKRLPLPRKAAGAQITQSQFGEVVTRNNDTERDTRFVIGMRTI